MPCSLTLSLLAETFANSLDLIWIQTLAHQSVLEIIFLKLILKKKSGDENKSMKNYPICKKLKEIIKI